MSEELAKITKVGFGNRDVGRPALFFTTELEDGSCALQILEANEAIELIKASGVYDLQALNGQFCWVDHDQSKVVFKRMWGV